jgi:hypothetical protein
VTGVGGSARALAKLARRRQNWPIGHSHGYFLRLEDIVELHEELSRMGLSDRAALPGLRQHRAETIAAGALAWEGIVRACGADGMRVSSHGLRGGLAIEALCPGAPDARGRRTAGILGRMPDPTGRGEPVRSRARAALDIGAKGADDTWLPALVLAAHAHCTGNADREHLVDNPVEGHLQEEVVLAARLLGLVPGKPPRPLADALATAVRS